MHLQCLPSVIGQQAPSDHAVHFVVPSLAHKSIRVSAPSYRTFLWRAIGATSLRLSPSDQSRPPAKVSLAPSPLVHRHAKCHRANHAGKTNASLLRNPLQQRCRHAEQICKKREKDCAPIQARNRDLIKYQKRYSTIIVKLI